MYGGSSNKGCIMISLLFSPMLLFASGNEPVSLSLVYNEPPTLIKLSNEKKVEYLGILVEPVFD